jgi:hypothetical protein
MKPHRDYAAHHAVAHWTVDPDELASREFVAVSEDVRRT